MLKDKLIVDLNEEGSRALAEIMERTGLKRSQVIHAVLQEWRNRIVQGRVNRPVQIPPGTSAEEARVALETGLSVTAVPVDDKSPYVERRTETVEVVHNPDYPQDDPCICGHPYYRHFDTYEDMANVGCKYAMTCDCDGFVSAAPVAETALERGADVGALMDGFAEKYADAPFNDETAAKEVTFGLMPIGAGSRTPVSVARVEDAQEINPPEHFRDSSKQGYNHPGAKKARKESQLSRFERNEMSVAMQRATKKAARKGRKAALQTAEGNRPATAAEIDAFVAACPHPVKNRSGAICSACGGRWKGQTAVGEALPVTDKSGDGGTGRRTARVGASEGASTGAAVETDRGGSTPSPPTTPELPANPFVGSFPKPGKGNK